MGETRTVFDPFELKTVEVSNRLIDRLRGKYASGPHLPNGKPEFGWKQFEAPPIQHEAAAVIEAKDAEITSLRSQLGEARRKAIEECAQIATAFAEVTAKLDGGLKSTTAAGMFNIAKSIRALLTESKT